MVARARRSAVAEPELWGAGWAMSTTEFVIVLTTLPADADMAPFAKTLVDEALAACVSFQPSMDSVYSWEGRIERNQERQVMIKTTTARVERLWARVRELHPYEVPEFLVIPIIDGNAAYLQWIRDSTTPRSGEGRET